jgi:RNA polymerase sigma-70 factor (ECF subfamily)
MALAAARMGPDDDFAELVRAHRVRVIGLCRRLLGPGDQAEDAAHEVFLRAHTRRQDFDRSRPFSSWVLSIAAHYCVDLLRRRSTESRIFGTEEAERIAVASDGVSPLGLLLLQERQQEVRDAIRSLPDKYRVPLVLSAYHEQSYDEIAQALGVPRSHVAMLLFRARQQLRRALSRPLDANNGSCP